MNVVGFGILLMAMLASNPATATNSMPHLDLDVSLDPRTRLLDVKAKVTVGASADPVEFELTEAANIAPEHLVLPGASQARSMELRYRLPLSALSALDHRDTLTDQVATGDPHGSFVPASSRWHPSPKRGMFTYRLKLTTPADQRGIAPGRLESESLNARSYSATFVFDAPSQAIDLMAGPYVIEERILATPSSIRVRTYFHAEINHLAKDYRDSAARYIEMYSQQIGAYPYSEFSIVSSPTPTGFGMPTLTYLGIDVLRLPFIRHTSLAHEVLHNWWGNGVYVDYESGNWCEGLTAFMADYAFKEKEGASAARAQRLGWLRDLSSLPENGDQSLRSFRSRTHGASQIVGYNKASMLFYMLREYIGRERFSESLRQFWIRHRFKLANWQDLQASFEATSGQPLGNFFTQSLDRTDLPVLRIVEAKVDTPETLRITLQQRSTPFDVRVPITVDTDKASITWMLSMTRVEQTFRIPFSGKAARIVLDSELQLMRKLDASELPPILRQVMIGADVKLVVPDGDSGVGEIARALADKLLDNAPVAASAPLGDTASILVIGTHARIDQVLAALGLRRPDSLRGKGSSQVWATRTSRGGIALVVSAKDGPALQALLRPLPHYGGQSYLVFDGNKAIEKGVWPSTPLEFVLNE